MILILYSFWYHSLHSTACSCTSSCTSSCTVRMKSDVPLRFGFVLIKLWKPHKTRSCGKEAIQNQEIYRIHANCSKVRKKSDVPLRLGFVLSELWKPNKTRSCEKKPHKTRRANCSKVRMKSNIPLRLGFEAKQNQELWEEATQNQERIHANSSKVRMKSDIPLHFGFVLSELWKPNKTRSCGKEPHKTRRESMLTVQK